MVSCIICSLVHTFGSFVKSLPAKSTPSYQKVFRAAIYSERYYTVHTVLACMRMIDPRSPEIQSLKEYADLVGVHPPTKMNALPPYIPGGISTISRRRSGHRGECIFPTLQRTVESTAWIYLVSIAAGQEPPPPKFTPDDYTFEPLHH